VDSHPSAICETPNLTVLHLEGQTDCSPAAPGVCMECAEHRVRPGQRNASASCCGWPCTDRSPLTIARAVVQERSGASEGRRMEPR
jgi:hypothetical protein